MRKEVSKIIYYVILLGMTLYLSACTETKGTPTKTEEAGTENTEVTEKDQEKQLYEYAEEDFLALSESYKEKGGKRRILGYITRKIRELPGFPTLYD